MRQRLRLVARPRRHEHAARARRQGGRDLAGAVRQPSHRGRRQPHDRLQRLDPSREAEARRAPARRLASLHRPRLGDRLPAGTARAFRGVSDAAVAGRGERPCRLAGCEAGRVAEGRGPAPSLRPLAERRSRRHGRDGYRVGGKGHLFHGAARPDRPPRGLVDGRVFPRGVRPQRQPRFRKRPAAKSCRREGGRASLAPGLPHDADAEPLQADGPCVPRQQRAAAAAHLEQQRRHDARIHGLEQHAGGGMRRDEPGLRGRHAHAVPQLALPLHGQKLDGPRDGDVRRHHVLHARRRQAARPPAARPRALARLRRGPQRAARHVRAQGAGRAAVARTRTIRHLRRCDCRKAPLLAECRGRGGGCQRKPCREAGG